MFGKLIKTGSWSAFVRGGLVGVALLMLAPAGLMIAIALAVLMAPVGIVAIPFMLPAFFGGAQHEHQEAVLRESMRPRPLALAHS